MKRLLQYLAAMLVPLLGLNSASAQTNVVVTPQTANPAAVTIGVKFNLGSEWEIRSSPFEKMVNSAGVPVWQLNTVAVRSVTAGAPTPRNVNLNYHIGAVAPGTAGRILWMFNGQTLSESTFNVPAAPDDAHQAGATLTVSSAAAATAVRVRVAFKEYATITGQNAPVQEENRFILEATATRTAVIQTFPPPPLPVFDLGYNLGQVADGTYSAVFKLNGTTLAEQPFTVANLPLPIPSTVTAAFETTSAGTVARVRIVLPDPYFDLSDPGTPVMAGNRITVNATLNGIATLVALPSPKVIEQTYPLGLIPPGNYLFQYSIKNNLKLTQTLQVEGPPAAPLQLAFVEVRPAPAGSGAGWVADAGVLISDSSLTVTGWGTALRSGNKFTATLVTGPRPPLDPADPANPGSDGELLNNPLIQAQAFVVSPGDVAAGVEGVRIERFRYELGELEAGTYELEILSGGQSAGLRRFIVQPTPPPPGPVVAGIGISKTSAGPWNATVRVVLPPGQTVTSWGEPRQENQQFKASLTIGPAVTPAADAADPANGSLGRALESFTYSLGNLEPGRYSFAVLQGDSQLAVRAFVVTASPPPPEVNQPRLGFIEIKQGDASAAAEVGVILPQPGFSIVSWGEISATGNHVKADLEILVDGVVPAVVLPPKLERHVYSLGVLPSGEYKLTISYHTATGAVSKELGTRAFEIGAPPPPPPVDPLPIIAFLEDGRNEQDSFIDLGLAWPFPGREVSDWGTTVREGNNFSVTLITGRAAPPVPGGAHADGVDLIPADGNIDLHALDAVREIGGWPTRLERHRYLLGQLPAGSYQFSVAVAGRVLARRAFTVAETVNPRPVVTVSAEPVRQSGTAPAPFTIVFNARRGWPADPSPGTVTVKGPQDFTGTARRLNGGILSLDPLGILAKGSYELDPPGGTWDPADNGIYDVFIDPDTVKDRQGRSPANPVGRITVQILPTPSPPAGLKAGVVAAMADGQWSVDVSFDNTGGWARAEWGTPTPRGSIFFASAKLTPPSEFERFAIPGVFTHRYELGELKPGSYSFVFRSSAGHPGQATIAVPGVEPPTPFDTWKFNAFGEAAWQGSLSDDTADSDGDGQSTLMEFAMGGNPRLTDRPEYRAEIVTGPTGAAHLALHYRRAIGSEKSVEAVVEASSNMEDWKPAGNDVEILTGPPDADGTQAVTARQTALLSNNRHPYLRLRFVKVVP